MLASSGQGLRDRSAFKARVQLFVSEGGELRSFIRQEVTMSTVESGLKLKQKELLDLAFKFRRSCLHDMCLHQLLNRRETRNVECAMASEFFISSSKLVRPESQPTLTVRPAAAA